MSFEKIFANLAAADLARTEAWYAVLFDRPADARPMKGLVEWHFRDAGLQVTEDAARAGKGTLTLMVGDLGAERARLAELRPGPVEEATAVSLVRMLDPAGNLVVLVGPKPG